MNPQTSPIIPSLGGWMVAALLMVIIVTLSVVAPGTVSGLIDGGRLLYGWIVVLIQWMGELRTIGLKGIGILLLAVVVATAAVHIFFMIVRKTLLGGQVQWRFRWTVSVVLLICCSFGGAGSLASLTFQTRQWMTLRQDLARRQENQNRMRTLQATARMYAGDNSGSYPWFLQDLLEDGYVELDQFEKMRHVVLSDGIKVPCMMLGGISDSASGSLPHVVSAQPVDGVNYAVVLNSGDVVIVNRQAYESLLDKWREEVADDKYFGQAVPLWIPQEERIRRVQLQARGGGMKGTR